MELHPARSVRELPMKLRLVDFLEDITKQKEFVFRGVHAAIALNVGNVHTARNSSKPAPLGPCQPSAKRTFQPRLLLSSVILSSGWGVFQKGSFSPHKIFEQTCLCSNL